ncbi:MAG: helix-turn-helix domain-containing protein [Clostridia bacterium]|nr:helix-turn-helix domain-containing protein [Clostridia bacterium]
MDFTKLNPVIRSASVYERLGRSEECIGYDCRVIYMISGDITAVVGGVKLGHLSPGHALYIPSGVPYRLKGQYLRAAVITFDLTDEHPEPNERISPVPVSDFVQDRCHSAAEYSPFDKVIHLEDMEADRDTFIRMCNIFTSAEGTYRAEISAMFKLILLKMAEVADENALPARMVEALDTYIRENVGDEISNTEIGAIFGYHPFYVSKLLKDKKGQTLRQYIIAYRLKAAKRLLELTARSINEIAEECGFTDASYFTKTFRQSFGMTPKDYRNSFKEDFI